MASTGLSSLTVGIWQDSGILGDIASNLAIISRETACASRRGVDLLIFPECFLTGYFNKNEVNLIARKIDQDTISALQITAKSNATAILVGYYEAMGVNTYNSAILIGSNGEILANYRKRALFGDWERSVFVPGSEPVLTVYQGIRIAILICFDVEFPELASECARNGADLIAVPTSNMEPYVHINRCLVPTRAIENQVYIAYANRIGSENHLHFVGESAIHDPEGTELARASYERPELILASVCPENT